MKLLILALSLALGLPVFAQTPPAPPPPSQQTQITTDCWDPVGLTLVVCGASGTGGTPAVVTPVVTPALANNLVIKASAGSLFSVYATNLTGSSSGYLQVYNLAAAPADGAGQTPVIMVPFSGGVASANYQGLPPAAFSNGIVAVVSSSPLGFTKTTGVLTAFISGLAR
jgi:hypothetical protein